MNSNILAATKKCENLSLKINSGERYRVSKANYSGSLWLQPQQEAYRLKLTGEVKSILFDFVLNKAGQKSHDDQGDPVWHLPFNGLMELIIEKFNRT